jgi:hypothetical protein
VIPVDLRGLVRKRLLEQRREPDGLLHASGDLLGSLRHAQLRLAGAPTIESELVSEVRLMTGTMWHTWLGESLVRAGVPVMQEVKLTPWLPEGWAGTADWVFYSAEHRAFVLGDLKTIKGEGMRWVLKEGAKEEHLWQLSCYWHALYDMGLPLVKGFGVIYLPMNDTTDRGERIEPAVMECEPIPREVIFPVMEARWAATQEYLYELPPNKGAYREVLSGDYSIFLTDKLAAPMARVQKIVWGGRSNVFDVKLVPHWSADYCPYSEELCPCSTQGTTKIGHYTLDGNLRAPLRVRARAPDGRAVAY